MASESAKARLTQADRVHVGWRYAQVHPDPGPPPGRPEEPERAPLPPPARRLGEDMAGRPLRIAFIGTLAFVALFLLCGIAGVIPWAFVAVALLACAVVLAITGGGLWRDERGVRERLAQERREEERRRAARERERETAERDYAKARAEWERRHSAYESQREWYPVAVPPGVDRVDVVGGTLAGWSAAVTTMGAARLAVGARLTVIDLSEGAVAHDLLRLAADRGDDPLVWVLPADLPRLDVTRGLNPEALADVLSLVVSAGEEEGGTRDLSFDNSILERLIEVLGPDTTIPRITAALRVLAQVGDPRDDLRKGLLTEEQHERIATLFGRDATDRIVVRRAWALEAQLRKLEKLATEPVRLPPSRLHVVSMDRRAGVLTNKILGTYVTTALTHRIREAPPGGRWDHTLFLCGAEKLRGDVLDRLIDACEATGTGLVLMYRSIPGHVRERLGRRGHAAVGFMRLGNPEDARVAAEHIGAASPSSSPRSPTPPARPCSTSRGRATPARSPSPARAATASPTPSGRRCPPRPPTTPSWSRASAPRPPGAARSPTAAPTSSASANCWSSPHSSRSCRRPRWSSPTPARRAAARSSWTPTPASSPCRPRTPWSSRSTSANSSKPSSNPRRRAPGAVRASSRTRHSTRPASPPRPPPRRRPPPGPHRPHPETQRPPQSRPPNLTTWTSWLPTGA
ncbi:hypothetical protein [Actinomadura madurae]|uniref:hypothetical protein n=1 Tax=Actinomadura madurae TaxID=1993 RepID=UPI0020D24E82|nr:hypothetical protein [Actinomadura madurae]MCQ0016221.1 hypothetical protein [Actinomadura madurae]